MFKPKRLIFAFFLLIVFVGVALAGKNTDLFNNTGRNYVWLIRPHDRSEKWKVTVKINNIRNSGNSGKVRYLCTHSDSILRCRLDPDDPYADKAPVNSFRAYCDENNGNDCVDAVIDAYYR